MFWADLMSRGDYESFSGVMSFDTSYGKNKYRKPVVMIIGINNHWQTVVYGVAMLSNENADTYYWFLKAFLVVIKGRKLVKVIRNGDKVMIVARKKVFPNTMHRLCSWHLERNAKMVVNVTMFMTTFG